MARSVLALVLAGSLCAAVTMASQPAIAQEHESPQPPRVKWSFAGPFGHYDKGQLQRGLKVYRGSARSATA
jgi:cytochrome c1